jgi:aryl-alcohol dehydrogenase-like predicted oxidoreductase
MRLSTDDDRDDRRAAEVIRAALQCGITVFDTARAYGRDDTERGHNERLLADAVRRCGAKRRARIVTKGGMTRAGHAWLPDGRAKAIRVDCEASLAALGGLPIDTFLLHAPDPRTPWPTSVRALAQIAEEGLVKRVGLSNVSRRQLDEALDLAPVDAVEVALSVLDDRPLRGGIVDRCAQLGISLIAHSPLGGPRRTRELERLEPLAAIARAHGVGPADVALAWLLGLSPTLIAIPGARRLETARSCARAAALELDAVERDRLDRAFGAARPRRAARAPRDDAEVVVVMGIPAAGKTRVAEEYVAAGYTRLNRDERGGRLRALAQLLDDQLHAGVRHVVLDNTYLTRASRSHVIDAASRHGLPARCIWMDTPLAQAQVNLVRRLLDQVGTLPPPDELRRLGRRHAGAMAPTSQMRALRELEPPSVDEGFERVEVVPFTRAEPARPGAPGIFVAAAALRREGWEAALRANPAVTPHLVYDWSPGGAADELQRDVARIGAVTDAPIHSALCPHPGGPPTCWCRPPLPGLLLAFARDHGVEPARSTLIGARPTDRTLANALGARYVEV